MATKIPASFSSSCFKSNASLLLTTRYGNREEIFCQGDAADAVFRVEKGTIKLTVKSKQGKVGVIGVLRAGECFGEGSLGDDSQRTCTATSMSESQVSRIGKKAILRRLCIEPTLAALFISHLLRRLAHSEEDHMDQLLNSSERRLARQLVRIASFTSDDKRSAPASMIDQGTLAQMVGTTRSRVSHFMNAFRNKGYVDYNGSLRVRKALLQFLDRDRVPARRVSPHH